MSGGGLVWPEFVAVEADGYTVADDNDVDRSPFDDGLMRQERRYASALSALSITVLIANDGDYRRFRAWAGGCAHRWFAWTAPESGSVHQVRVRGGAGGIEYTARVGGDGRRTWEAALVILRASGCETLSYPSSAGRSLRSIVRPARVDARHYALRARRASRRPGLRPGTPHRSHPCKRPLLEGTLKGNRSCLLQRRNRIGRCSPSPTPATIIWRSPAPTRRRAGNNLIAAAGRAEIDLGREAGDPAGEAKNLAAVDFAPTALVENATHFAIMTAAAGGNVRAWGRLLNDQGQPATVSQQTEDDILRVPAGAVVVRIPAGT